MTKLRRVGTIVVVVVLLFAFFVPISTITVGTTAVINDCPKLPCTTIINPHNVTVSITYIYFKFGGTWGSGGYRINLSSSS